jgi:hypothetical protein
MGAEVLGEGDVAGLVEAADEVGGLGDRPVNACGIT